MNPGPEPTAPSPDSSARTRVVRALLGWRSTAAVASPPVLPPKAMRLSRALPILLVVILALLGGCDRASNATVLWHAYNGAERTALTAAAARWNAAHPDHPLELVAVPYAAFADKLTSAIPNGNGPDLFIYSQDRIGDWADAGTIEPIEFWIDEARASRFSDEAVAAMAYQGSLWGLPLAVKSLALYYRTDLVAVPPKTTDELLALARTMAKRRGYAVAYANVDLYGHAPWLFGFGGKVIDRNGDLAIATPEAAAAMTFARKLVADGAAPDHADGPMVGSMFVEGKAAMAISGPWFQYDIPASVPWNVTVLPTISATGKPAAPFYSAEGVLMSARAHDKDTAFAIMDELSTDVAAIERAKAAHELVPNTRALEDPEVAADPIIRVFRAQIANTVQMPKDPAMRMVWTPYQTALGEVVGGRAESGAQLLSVEKEVAGYLAPRSK